MQLLNELVTGHLHVHLQVWVQGAAIVEPSVLCGSAALLVRQYRSKGEAVTRPYINPLQVSFVVIF